MLKYMKGIYGRHDTSHPDIVLLRNALLRYNMQPSWYKKNNATSKPRDVRAHIDRGNTRDQHHSHAQLLKSNQGFQITSITLLVNEILEKSIA